MSTVKSSSAVWFATIQLLMACTFWGFGFVATRFAMESWGAFGLTGVRFFLSSLVVAALALLLPSVRAKFSSQQLFLALIPGVFLALTLTLQTYGLFETTVTNSGFLTTLYVLSVPFVEAWLLGSAIMSGHFVLVAVALVGTAMLSGFLGQSLNRGDAWTIGCSITAALHIVWISKVSPKVTSDFMFNAYQSFWAGVICLVASLFFEGAPTLNASSKAWTGMVFLIFGSTLLAFLIQLRVQRVLTASTASLLFLLEAPFAALFGIMFFDEKLSATQWTGACLILLASAMTAWRAGRKSVQAAS